MRTCSSFPSPAFPRSLVPDRSSPPLPSPPGPRSFLYFLCCLVSMRVLLGEWEALERNHTCLPPPSWAALQGRSLHSKATPLQASIWPPAAARTAAPPSRCREVVDSFPRTRAPEFFYLPSNKTPLKSSKTKCFHPSLFGLWSFSPTPLIFSPLFFLFDAFALFVSLTRLQQADSTRRSHSGGFVFPLCSIPAQPAAMCQLLFEGLNG